MKILNARIRYSEQFSNYPTLEVLVDKIPDHNDLVYDVYNGLYFAELDGYVSFMYWDRPGDGFAGRVFNINVRNPETEDIEQVSLKGPWSSCSGAVNSMDKFQQCMEVSLTDDPEAFERGYTLYASALTIEKAEDALKFIQGSGLIKRAGNEVTYFATKTGFTKIEDKIELIATWNSAWDKEKREREMNSRLIG